MTPRVVHPLDAITFQQAHIAVLTDKLQRAEQAVARARTAETAADAHRRADALLLQLETAETDLEALLSDVPPAAASGPLPRRRRRQPVRSDQAALFDVG